MQTSDADALLKPIIEALDAQLKLATNADTLNALLDVAATVMDQFNNRAIPKWAWDFEAHWFDVY